jgi:hypothetical protein
MQLYIKKRLLAERDSKERLIFKELDPCNVYEIGLLLKDKEEEILKIVDKVDIIKKLFTNPNLLLWNNSEIITTINFKFVRFKTDTRWMKR